MNLRPTPAPRDAGTLSQWQLIRLNFAKHRLAVVSLELLVILYLVAIFAELVAPMNPGTKHLAFIHAPPQLPRVSFEHGLHVRALEQRIDPVTLRRTYVESETEVVGLTVFARGEGYRLFGLIPGDVRLLGTRAAPDGTRPPVFFLGADQYGRDLLSRMIHGSRVSLSVGLIGIAITFALGMTIGGISGYVGGRAAIA